MRRRLAPITAASLLTPGPGGRLLGGTQATETSPTSATPEQLATLESILARPEFRAAEGRNLLDALFDPIRAVLRGLYNDLLRWLLGDSRPGGDLPGYAALLVPTLIVLIAVVVVVRLTRGGLASEAELAEMAESGPPRAEAELVRARTLAEAGDLRAAVHYRYLAVLRRLDERGLLPFDRSLTNREHLPRVADAAVASALAPLVAEFDGLWYGQSTCSRDEYDRFAGLADRVWQAAG